MEGERINIRNPILFKGVYLLKILNKIIIIKRNILRERERERERENFYTISILSYKHNYYINKILKIVKCFY